ncbi:MAG: Trm112 family protein [Planctomycetia bacterium]|nr:MAG: Trm112 family protein [Planctomycetia bacterium]
MMLEHLLEILVCPETRTRLRLAEPDLLAALNDAIGRGQIVNQAGDVFTSPLECGLIREDGQVLYPVIDGIPILLMDEAIPLEQLAGGP